MRISDWSSDVCSSDLILHVRSSCLLPSRHLPSHPHDERAQCQSGAPGRQTSFPPDHCPGIGGITVPYLLKSLSAIYRNRCPGISETRSLLHSSSVGDRKSTRLNSSH